MIVDEYDAPASSRQPQFDLCARAGRARDDAAAAGAPSRPLIESPIPRLSAGTPPVEAGAPIADEDGDLAVGPST